MGRDLTADERVSVARAATIVRMAGFTDKADRIDNMLQGGDIAVDSDLGPENPGRTSKVVIFPLNLIVDPTINLSPSLFPGAQPMSPTGAALLRLAVVLHHEADHAKCDDELAAWGGTYEFLCAVNENLTRIYHPPFTSGPGLSGAELEAIEKLKEELKKKALEEREEIAKRGGGHYGEDFRPPRNWVPGGPFKLGELIVLPRERVSSSRRAQS